MEWQGEERGQKRGDGGGLREQGGKTEARRGKDTSVG